MPIYAYIVAHACMRSSIYIEAISKDDDVSSPMLSSSGWCICILLTKIFSGRWPIVDQLTRYDLIRNIVLHRRIETSRIVVLSAEKLRRLQNTRRRSDTDLFFLGRTTTTPLELDPSRRLLVQSLLPLLSGQIMPSEDIKLPFSTVKDPRDLCVHRYLLLLLNLRSGGEKLSRWKNEIRRD